MNAEEEKELIKLIDEASRFCAMSNCMLEVLETNSNFYKRMKEEYHVYVQ